MKYRCPSTTCPTVNNIPCIVICPPSSYSYDSSLPKDFNIKAPAPSIRNPRIGQVQGIQLIILTILLQYQPRLYKVYLNTP